MSKWQRFNARAGNESDGVLILAIANVSGSDYPVVFDYALLLLGGRVDHFTSGVLFFAFGLFLLG